MDKYIDYRCKIWARWARRGGQERIGYSDHTLEAELMEMGGVLISGKGMKPQVEHNPRAEQIESGLRQLERGLVDVAKVRYLRHGSKRDKAKELHCSVAQYFRQVNRLHIHLQEYLDSQKEGEKYLNST